MLEQVKVVNYQESLSQAKPDHEGTLIATLIDMPVGMVMEEVPANLNIAPHYHNEGDDFFMIFSGRCTLYLAELADDKKTHIHAKTIELRPGDCFAIPPKVIHGFENDGDEPLLILNCAPQTHTTSDIFYV